MVLTCIFFPAKFQILSDQLGQVALNDLEALEFQFKKAEMAHYAKLRNQ